ncbi:undecaprenyl-diphosphatase UppP [Candidatus Saccharibacteria bacterium]|nr:undecaprenyl-diphosphatase UppP [Candidatus Saccharibacteria bacterium]
MTIIEAAISGVVQGLTEFLPVSSSGHLVLLSKFFGENENALLFDVALHAGTLAALVIYFWKDILRLAKAFFVQSALTKPARLIAVATIPAIIAGTLLQGFAEDTFRSAVLVAVNMMLMGGMMLWAERLATQQTSKLEKVTTKQALVMGFAQALAVIPGVSRSGSTITAGLFVGLDRVTATRFSFLLGIPIISGALLKVLLDGGLESIGTQAGVFLIGIFAAFLSGLFAIKFMLSYLSKHSLAVFAYYRIALGIVVLLVVLL